jgi:hypothetical protein
VSLLRYLLKFFEGIEENHKKNLNQDGQFLVWDLHPQPLEYKAGVLTTMVWSVFTWFITCLFIIMSLVFKYALYALKLSYELSVICRCKLGFYNTGSDIQECLTICTAFKQRWGPCEELSATDPCSLRHAELPSTTDTFRISVNKKSLTSYLWSYSESKLIYISFIVVNYLLLLFLLLLLLLLILILLLP